MIKKNFIANLIGRSWGSVLSIILIPVYIRYLGVESYGLVGFYIALTSIFSVFDLGIGSTLNREMAIRTVNSKDSNSLKDLVRTLEIIYWIISISIGVIIIAIAPYISKNWIHAQHIPLNILINTIRLMGLSLIFQFPISLYQGGLMGLQKQVPLNIIFIITGTFRGIGVIFVFNFLSKEISSFFVWQLISNILAIFFLYIYLWKYIPRISKPRFQSKILNEIKSYAAVLSINSLIGILLTQLDKIILSRTLSLELFSYYSIATTVSSVVWILATPVNSTVFPKFAQLKSTNNDEGLSGLFHKSSQVMTLILVPICLTIIFFSKYFLMIWLHDQKIVENCQLIVSLLLFGTLLNGLASLPSNCAIAFGFPKLVTITNLLQAIFLIPIILILVNYYQAIGATIAWIILNSLYFIFMIPYFFRKYLVNEKNKWFVFDIFLPLIISASICLISKFLMPTNLTLIFALIWILFTFFISILFTLLIMSETRALFKKYIYHEIFERKN